MLFGTSPALTRNHSIIAVELCCCSDLLIPALASSTATHYRANSSSSKYRNISLKWKIHSHICGFGCSKSNFPSFLGFHTLYPVIGLPRVKDNYIIRYFPHIHSLQPMINFFHLEATQADRSHRDKLVAVEQEEERDQSTSDNGQVKLDKIFLEDSREAECREMTIREKRSNENKGKVLWNKGTNHKPENPPIVHNRRQNKVKVPWNKGRKHTPETLSLIRERTIKAMLDPKVRQKIVQNRHYQHSDTSKARIGASIKEAWNRRHKRKLIQQTCLYEWEESIAQASRKGGDGDDELNWDSYEILKGKIEQEWLQSRKMAKLENKCTSKRRRKTDTEKLRISQAIKAKWADPEFRQRHRAGIYKFLGKDPPLSPGIAESWESKDTERKTSSKPKNPLLGQTSVRNFRALRLSSNVKNKSHHAYSNLLVRPQFQRENQIQTDQLNMEIMIRAATERASLLIAETEKAAKLLEPTGVKDLSVRDSLYEAHKLLAEAIQLMHKVEAWRYSSVGILSTNDATSTNASIFQSHSGTNNSCLSASGLLGPRKVNEKLKKDNVLNFRFKGSQYALQQNTPLGKEISSEQHLNCFSTAFHSPAKPEPESVHLAEKSDGNVKSNKGTLPIKTVSDCSSEVFNSTMVNEHNMEGAVGNFETRCEKKNMSSNFHEGTISVGSFFPNNKERSFVQHDVLTSTKRTKRWLHGRLVDIKDE